VGIPTALGVQFVNTDLATLSGGELYGEYDLNTCLTPFARLSYVEGRDHSRDNRGIPLLHKNGNTLAVSDEEPLPGIAPLESRVGVRVHEPVEKPRWGMELAARVVDNQDRVATSLREQESAGFSTWDFRSYWQATDSLLLVAGVENFTDKQYREHLDLRTGSGANFYFGCELQY
jgi:outer membrane receptor protein involved in Fe transport